VGPLDGSFAGFYRCGAREVPRAIKTEFFMRRIPVNKQRSAKVFRKQVSKTKYANVKAGPMRGGIRL
jgi:hypothetical protein